MFQRRLCVAGNMFDLRRILLLVISPTPEFSTSGSVFFLSTSNTFPSILMRRRVFVPPRVPRCPCSSPGLLHVLQVDDQRRSLRGHALNKSQERAISCVLDTERAQRRRCQPSLSLGSLVLTFFAGCAIYSSSACLDCVLLGGHLSRTAKGSHS